MSKSSYMAGIALVAMALGHNVAWATTPPPPPTPTPTPSSEASAGAGALAVGLGKGGEAQSSAVGLGGKANAVGLGGTAKGGEAQAYGGKGGAGGAGGRAAADSYSEGSTGVGTVEGDSTEVHGSWGLALSPPAATAAPAVAGECLVHSRGWAAGFGAAARSGGTALEAACIKHVQCLQLADRLAAWNQMAMAVAQLQSCGGVPGTYVPPPVFVAPPAEVTKGDLTALEQRLTERQDRQFEKSVGK